MPTHHRETSHWRDMHGSREDALTVRRRVRDGGREAQGTVVSRERTRVVRRCVHADRAPPVGDEPAGCQRPWPRPTCRVTSSQAGAAPTGCAFRPSGHVWRRVLSGEHTPHATLKPYATRRQARCSQWRARQNNSVQSSRRVLFFRRASCRSGRVENMRWWRLMILSCSSCSSSSWYI
jgi:hypothetical protein